MAEPRDTYWRRIHREAWRRAKANVMGSPSGIILSVFALGVAIWGLAVFGSEDAAKDEIVLRACLAGFSLLTLTMLYLFWFKRLPEEWDEDLHKRIEALEAGAIPRIEFVWRADDTKFLQDDHVRAAGKTSLGTVGRVAVKNITESISIINVEVSLVNIEKDESKERRSIDKKLLTTNGEGVVDLHARREATYTLFQCAKNDRQMRIGRFVDGSLSEPIDPGLYKLKLTASATNIPRLDAYYMLAFDAKGHIEFRPWNT